jgi:hypothetical protein
MHTLVAKLRARDQQLAQTKAEEKVAREGLPYLC